MTEDHLVIVMEYASGGTLDQRILTGGPLPEDKARDLFLQLVSSLEYCHSRRSAQACWLLKLFINSMALSILEFSVELASQDYLSVALCVHS